MRHSYHVGAVGVTGAKPLPRIPPPRVPLAELARWLSERHGLTESETGDVVVDLRRCPFGYWTAAPMRKHLTKLERLGGGERWWAGRARWKQYPDSNYFPLVVAWEAVTAAVNLRKRPERLALQAPAGAGATVPRTLLRSPGRTRKSATPARGRSADRIRIEMTSTGKWSAGLSLMAALFHPLNSGTR